MITASNWGASQKFPGARCSHRISSVIKAAGQNTPSFLPLAQDESFAGFPLGPDYRVPVINRAISERLS